MLHASASTTPMPVLVKSDVPWCYMSVPACSWMCFLQVMFVQFLFTFDKSPLKQSLGGGFKYFLFSSLFGEDEPNLTFIFFRWVGKKHQADHHFLLGGWKGCVGTCCLHQLAPKDGLADPSSTTGPSFWRNHHFVGYHQTSTFCVKWLWYYVCLYQRVKIVTSWVELEVLFLHSDAK